MIYFDPSYLVRLYYQDSGADRVQALAATDHVACAALGPGEMIAAFHRKLREGSMRPSASPPAGFGNAEEFDEAPRGFFVEARMASAGTSPEATDNVPRQAPHHVSER